MGAEALPTQYGGSLALPRIFKSTRTITTVLPSGRLMRDVLVVPPSALTGRSVRFKWYTKPGDVKFSLHFYAAPCPEVLRSGGGVTQPEAPRFCHAPSEAVPAAHVAALAPLAAVCVEVAALADHPASDTKPVTVAHALPASGGFYVATYNNLAGWRQREVFHRCVRAGGRAGGRRCRGRLRPPPCRCRAAARACAPPRPPTHLKLAPPLLLRAACRWDIVIDGRPVENPLPYLSGP